ncbi:hypothetical protein [Spirosoma daeguense]
MKNSYRTIHLFLIALIFSLFLTNLYAQTGAVGINTDGSVADPSALLDVKSTNQGMLVPRMTAQQRSNIANPAKGLLVFQNDAISGFYYYDGLSWTSLNGNSSGDNLGNHTATQDLNMNDKKITNVASLTTTGAATLGGTTYPTSTGTANQVLGTNGAGTANWVTVPGASLQLAASIATAITTPVGSSLVLGDIIDFTNLKTSPTLGNTWSGNKFTVGANGAGLYAITIQLTSSNTFAAPMIDMNGTGNNGTSFYGMGLLNTQTFQNPYKGRGFVSAMVYLNAGEFFQIRASSGSQVIGALLNGDGSSNITVVKLN